MTSIWDTALGALAKGIGVVAYILVITLGSQQSVCHSFLLKLATHICRSLHGRMSCSVPSGLITLPLQPYSSQYDLAIAGRAFSLLVYDCDMLHSSSSALDVLQHMERCQLALLQQVFKHYMKSDAPDYGDTAMTVRTKSRKRVQRTDSMQGAVQGNGDIASADRFESRATDAGTPPLPDHEGVSPGTALSEANARRHALHIPSAVTAEVERRRMAPNSVPALHYAPVRNTLAVCERDLLLSNRIQSDKEFHSRLSHSSSNFITTSVVSPIIVYWNLPWWLQW